MRSITTLSLVAAVVLAIYGAQDHAGAMRLLGAVKDAALSIIRVG